jgi:outer membrane protein assembly factor BamB
MKGNEFIRSIKIFIKKNNDVMKMRTNHLIAIVLVINILGIPVFGISEWGDYMGNSQKTAYTTCNGPEAPEILWKTELVKGGFDTSPFIIEEGILALSKDDIYHILTTKIVLFDFITGDVLQEFIPVTPKKQVIFEVFPVDGQVMGTSITDIYKIDFVSKTGVFLSEIPRRSYGTLDSYPIILMDRIIFPTHPPVCFSKSDFNMMWDLHITLDENLHPYNLAGDEDIVVFIIAEEGITKLLAVNPSTGSIRWESDPLPLSLWITLGENTLYCGGEKLWAYDTLGNEIWHFTPDERIVSNIVLGPDALYSVDNSNHLYKIGLDGTLIWKTDCQVSPWYYNTHLVGAGHILYCLRNEGTPDSVTKSSISAFDMNTGTEMWELESDPPSNIIAAPVVAGGVLIITKENGAIVALASDPHLFEQQGDAFLSQELPDKAAESYRKASELYERSGNQEKTQEMHEKITQLELSSESAIPSKTQSLIFPILCILGIVIVSTFLYVFVIQKRSKK